MFDPVPGRQTVGDVSGRRSCGEIKDQALIHGEMICTSNWRIGSSGAGLISGSADWRDGGREGGKADGSFECFRGDDKVKKVGVDRSFTYGTRI
jgi:hypothetical protein